MGFSVSLLLQTHTCTKFIVPEVHFHNESIGTSPVVIARKTAKLFKFLDSPTPRNRTIVASRIISCPTTEDNAVVSLELHRLLL